ncbi:MAG TPA: DNA repair protein RadC [Chitinophagaceae bacterium]|nr:DNA repair protein RadC [Chitinophagaceae bacterium]
MQEQKYSIKNWAKDDRPREKLLMKGAQNLSNSELLAILLRSGNTKQSAVELAQTVLHKTQNNLQELGKITVKELMKIKGIGEAKAITIAAAMELGRRRHETTYLAKQSITSSRDIAEYLMLKLKNYRHEVFAVCFLNNANKINDFKIISEGGMTGTIADPRIILKFALENNAVNLILCHNHPSGNLKPSKADEQLTEKIKKAAALMDITILDHIIVSEEGYFSFADEGKL